MQNSEKGVATEQNNILAIVLSALVFMLSQKPLILQREEVFTALKEVISDKEIDPKNVLEGLKREFGEGEGRTHPVPYFLEVKDSPRFYLSPEVGEECVAQGEELLSLVREVILSRRIFFPSLGRWHWLATERLKCSSQRMEKAANTEVVVISRESPFEVKDNLEGFLTARSLGATLIPCVMEGIPCKS